MYQSPKPFVAEEIYNQLNISSLHGQNKDALAKSKLGGWKYDIIEPGYKCNMTDITATIGLVELERYDSETLRRREIMLQYNTYFSNKPWAELPVFETADKTSSYHLYQLRIKNITEDQRNAIIDREIFKQGVSVNVHFQPLPLLSFYKGLGYKIGDYPQAYDCFSREISLPVYFTLTDSELKQVCEAISNAVSLVLN